MPTQESTNPDPSTEYTVTDTSQSAQATLESEAQAEAPSFGSFMSSVCDTIKGNPLLPAPPCSGCSSNKSYSEPLWRGADYPKEAYFNEKTCEWTYVFNTPHSLRYIVENYPSSDGTLTRDGVRDYLFKEMGLNENSDKRVIVHAIQQILVADGRSERKRYICGIDNCEPIPTGYQAAIEHYHDAIFVFAGGNPGVNAGFAINKWLRSIGYTALADVPIGIEELFNISEVAKEIRDLAAAEEKNQDVLYADDALLSIQQNIDNMFAPHHLAKLKELINLCSHPEAGYISQLNEYGLEWVTEFQWTTSAPAGVMGANLAPLRIKITIPIDFVQNIPTLAQEQTDALAEEAALGSGNELSAPVGDFYLMNFRLRAALRVYGKFYSAYWETKNTCLVIDHPDLPPTTVVKPRQLGEKLRTDLTEFVNNLETFIENCGYIYDIWYNWFEASYYSFTQDKASEIRLVFDDVDEGTVNPFALKEIFVKPLGCEWVLIGALQPTDEQKKAGCKTLPKNLQKFNKRHSAQTSINPLSLISKLRKCDNDIRAVDTMEWNDFYIEHCFPKLKFADEAAFERTRGEGMSGCDFSLDLAKMFEKGVDYVEDLWEIIASKMNEEACGPIEDVAGNNPVNKFLGIADLNIYQSNSEDDHRQSLSTIQDYNKNKRGAQANYDATVMAAGMGAATAEDVARAKKQTGGFKAFEKLIWNRMNEKMEQKDSVERLFYDLLGLDSSGKINWNGLGKGQSKHLLSKLALCDANELMLAALKCLFGGLSFEKVAQILVQSILSQLTLEQLDWMLAALPMDTQVKVQAKVEKIIAELPSPFGGNWQSGTRRTDDMSSFDVGFKSYAPGTSVSVSGGIGGGSDTKGGGWQGSKSKTRTAVAKRGEDREGNKSQSTEWQESKYNDGDDDDYSSPGTQIDYDEFTDYDAGYAESRVEVTGLNRRTTNEQRDEIIRNIDQVGQNSFVKATGDILAVILQAYVDALKEFLSIQEWLNMLQKFPAGGFLLQLLKSMLGYCPSAPWFSPSPFAFMRKFTFSVCDPTIGFMWPILPRINFTNIWGFIKQMLIELLIDLLIKFILALFMKIFGILGDLLCKALGLLGDVLCHVGAAVGGAVGGTLSGGQYEAATAASTKALGCKSNIFSDLLGDFMCDDVMDKKQRDQAVLDDVGKLMENLGFTPEALAEHEIDPSNLINCITMVISQLTTKQELLSIFASSDAYEDPAVQAFLVFLCQALQTSCPEIKLLWGEDPDCDDFVDRLKEMFDIIRDGMDPELLTAIRDVVDSLDPDDLPEEPAVANICLTGEELEEWLRIRRGLLEGYGINPEDVTNLLNENEDAHVATAQELADLAAKGLDAALAEMFDGLFEPEPLGPEPSLDDPLCNPNRRPTSMIPNYSEEVQGVFNKVSGQIFNKLNNTFTNESIGDDGMINKILSDTEGNSYSSHRFYRAFWLTEDNYFDSAEQMEVVEEAQWFPDGDGKGFFPRTVGAHCRNFIIGEEFKYSTQEGNVAMPEYRSAKNWYMNDENKLVTIRPSYKEIGDMSLEWTSGDSLFPKLDLYDGDYKIDVSYDNATRFDDIAFDSIGNLKDMDYDEVRVLNNSDVTVMPNFDYQITTRHFLDEEITSFQTTISNVSIDDDVKEYIKVLSQDFNISTTGIPRGTGYRVPILNATFLRKVYNYNGSGDPRLYDTTLFDGMFNAIAEYQRKALVCKAGVDLTTLVEAPTSSDTNAKDTGDLSGFDDIYEQLSPGWKFGYELDSFTEDDLTYVGPDGEEPYGDYFTNDQKVLGRSKTEHPRVHFLNPEFHGGRYTKPKIWLEPAGAEGWLQMSRVIAPPATRCKSTKTILQISDIADRVKTVSRMIPQDKRLYQEKKCANEVPFDRILDKDTHANIEGLVRASIRIHATEEIIQSLPILTNVKMNSKNYGNYFSKSVFNVMKQQLQQQRVPLWMRILNLTRYQTSNYWYLFLEQAVQTYQRKIDVDGFEPPPHIMEAFARIGEFQSLFPAVNRKRAVDFRDNWEKIPDQRWPGYKFEFDMYTYAPSNDPDDPTPVKSAGPLKEYMQGMTAAGDDLETSSIKNKRRKFYLDALAFCAYGESVFMSEYADEDQYPRPDFPMLDWWVPVMHDFVMFAAKIYSIRLLEKDCEMILAELITEEVDSMMDLFYESIDPTILNTNMYLLSKPEIFVGSKLGNLGTAQFERELEFGNFPDPGDVMDVCDPANGIDPFSRAFEHNPSLLQNADTIFEEAKENGKWFIEKYVRITKSRATGVEGGDAASTDQLIMTIDEFRDKLSNLDPQDHLHKHFGDLQFTYGYETRLLAENYSPEELEDNFEVEVPDEAKEAYELGDDNAFIEFFKGQMSSLTRDQVLQELDPENPEGAIERYNQAIDDAKDLITPKIEPNGVSGEMGINYGIRICYVPSEKYYQSQFSSEYSPTFDLDGIPKPVGEVKRAFDVPVHPQAHEGSRVYVPMATFEYGLIDETIENFFDEVLTKNEIDMACLVKGLVETAEFKLIFDNCISTRSVNDFILAFVKETFIKSIGFADGWVPKDSTFFFPWGHYQKWASEDKTENEWPWTTVNFGKSKKLLRQLFVALYTNQDFDNPDSSGGMGLGFWEIMKLLFPSWSFSINFDWFFGVFGHRLVDEDPFDDDGKDCPEKGGFLGLFK